MSYTADAPRARDSWALKKSSYAGGTRGTRGWHPFIIGGRQGCHGRRQDCHWWSLGGGGWLAATQAAVGGVWTVGGHPIPLFKPLPILFG